MNPRLSGALRVLAALDGEPVPRKPVEPRRVTQRLCRNPGCGVQIVIAHLPTGAWCALDIAPAGEMTIVNATVREWADIFADAPRYSFHRCRKDAR